MKTKMRKIDWVVVFVCAVAAALCGAGSIWSAPCFIVSSTIGLVDSVNKKILSAALINGIFLTLNIYFIVKNFM